MQMLKRLGSFLWQLGLTWGIRLFALVGALSAIQLWTDTDIFQVLPGRWRIPTLFVALFAAAFQVYSKKQGEIDELEGQLEDYRKQPLPDLDIEFNDGDGGSDTLTIIKEPSPRHADEANGENTVSMTGTQITFSPPRLSVTGANSQEIALQLTNVGRGEATDIHIWLDVPEELEPQEKPYRLITGGNMVHVEGGHVTFIRPIEKLQGGLTGYLPKFVVNPPARDEDYPVRWRAKAEEVEESFEGTLTLKVRTETSEPPD